MRKYKTDSPIIVKWVDTYQNPQWMSNADANKRPKCDCVTVGFYIKHDNELLYLSSTISGNERDLITIPIGCISNTKRLKYRKG